MVKNRLLEIRLNRGYKKQKDFADYIGMNDKTYSQIENNKKQVSLDNAFKIANKLNLKIEEIWQYSE